MAVVLAALSLPPLSALTWCGLARLADAPAYSDRTSGAPDFTPGAESETPEVANLLLSFGVRRADDRAASCPTSAPPDVARTHAETTLSTAPPRPEAGRFVGPPRADASQGWGRLKVRGRTPAGRRQERRRCAVRRTEAHAAKPMADPTGQDIGDARGERPEPLPASCQTEGAGARSRMRL